MNKKICLQFPRDFRFFIGFVCKYFEKIGQNVCVIKITRADHVFGVDFSKHIRADGTHGHVVRVITEHLNQHVRVVVVF